MDEKKEVSEKFIQPYIEREALRIMFENDLIPNIYDVRFSSFRSFPFEKEVLMAVSAHPRVDNLLRTVLIEELQIKLSNLGKNTQLAASQKSQMSDGALLGALKFLEERGLIEFTNKERDSLVLTQKGWEIQRICETEYYIGLCERKLKDELKGAAPNNLFWKIASASTPYQEVILEKVMASGGLGL